MDSVSLANSMVEKGLQLTVVGTADKNYTALHDFLYQNSN